MTNSDLAATYAALILADEGIEISVRIQDSQQPTLDMSTGRVFEHEKGVWTLIRRKVEKARGG